jgi:hypothetical protein
VNQQALENIRGMLTYLSMRKRLATFGEFHSMSECEHDPGLDRIRCHELAVEQQDQTFSCFMLENSLAS